jgi:4'-phosphopantetheinyl transferase
VSGSLPRRQRGGETLGVGRHLLLPLAGKGRGWGVTAAAPELQLWLLPRDADRLRHHYDAGLNLLSETERERAGCATSAAQARRFVLGRVLMRRALAAHLGVDPASLVIVPDPVGKPALLEPACPGLAFSLAHSRHEWGFALARGEGLGIDLEPIDRMRGILRIARTFYSAAERERLAGSVGTDAAAALQLWTLKEAVIKAVGGTVWQAVHDVRLALDAGRIVWLAPPPAGDEAAWSLALGCLRADHWLALALRSCAAPGTGLSISTRVLADAGGREMPFALQLSSGAVRLGSRVDHSPARGA